MALNDDANVNADTADAADTTSDNNGQDDLLPAPSFGGCHLVTNDLDP
jgi:hypothetical protein